MLKVLLIGSSGLIGTALGRFLGRFGQYKIILAQRTKPKLIYDYNQWFQINDAQYLDEKYLKKMFEETKPDAVINCLGITKHRMNNIKISEIIFINSVLPQILCEISSEKSIRMIQISTDCVFSGKRGDYIEADFPDPQDFYGRSKFLGELVDERMLTLRTSTIGHEIGTKFGLLEWFLSQKNQCKGFNKAIFSGLTTIELTRVMAKYVLPDNTICGVNHLGGNKINKYDLLKIISNEYNKNINILPSEELVIDRSFSSEKFYNKTGYKPKNWDCMISEMRQARYE